LRFLTILSESFLLLINESLDGPRYTAYRFDSIALVHEGHVLVLTDPLLLLVDLDLLVKQALDRLDVDVLGALGRESCWDPPRFSLVLLSGGGRGHRII
jgi:hypothetical protein